jgi:hypothetical protein
MRLPPTWRNRGRERPDPAIARDRRWLSTTGGAATTSARSCAGHAVSALDDCETGSTSLPHRSPAIGRKRESTNYLVSRRGAAPHKRVHARVRHVLRGAPQGLDTKSRKQPHAKIGQAPAALLLRQAWAGEVVAAPALSHAANLLKKLDSRSNLSRQFELAAVAGVKRKSSAALPMTAGCLPAPQAAPRLFAVPVIYFKYTLGMNVP